MGQGSDEDSLPGLQRAAISWRLTSLAGRDKFSDVFYKGANALVKGFTFFQSHWE